MNRFLPYTGIIVALALGALLVLWFGKDIMPRAVIPAAPALTVPTTTAETSKPPSAARATTSKAAPERKPAVQPVAPVTQARTPSPVASAEPSTPAPAPVSSTTTQAAINAGLDTAASALRAALVNILCYAPAGSPFHSVSGSGVIIDSKGIILTNAHVAQYFLLADRGISCAIRTGSPAQDAYEASLIYLSPTWLHDNAKVITESAPSGTGERDYALLGITQSATDAPLPATFPSVPLAIAPPYAGTPVVIGSYGAQFLEARQVEDSLFPTLVFGSVKNVFTFATDTIDVFSLGGSAAAQEGSSGGGVVGAHGKLLGIITTSTVSGSTATRNLNAITAYYIRGDYATENAKAIDLLIAEPVPVSIAAFAPKEPALEAMITTGLGS